MANDQRPIARVRVRFIIPVVLLALLSASQPRAEVVPPRGDTDGRVRATLYDAEQVYRLYGFAGYQIDLEFEPGESFVGLGAGDLEGLSYFGEENHLFLKPKAAQVATNLTVLTNKRHYQFDYSAQSKHPEPDDPEVIFALRFVYPATASKASEAAAAAKLIDSELLKASSQRQQNLDYWYCGGPALRPVSASDDGVRTRLRFAANTDLPAIFVRGDDDTESLLNYSMDKGDVILHRIARRFILRRGKTVGCIVNKGFGGGGIRLDSGTIAPGVERVGGGTP